MLVLDGDEIGVTDTANHAIEALASSTVREVVLLGRRGPAQAAFTNPELLELGELSRTDVIVDPADMELDAESAAHLASDASGKTARRNVEILSDYAAREPAGRTHRIVLRFLRSPLEVIVDDAGRVAGLRVGINRIERREDGSLAAVGTGEEETIDCGVILRSIGYRGRPVDGLPFDERRGIIANVDGRIVEDGEARAGEYVVGWIKRGPSGVIGTNKKDAAGTVARILEDAGAGALSVAGELDHEALGKWIVQRAPDAVSWGGWEAIDLHERTAGEPHGRPRVKLTRVEEMTSIADRR
jgi:ferredoxin--NADP+ reductase